MDFPSSTSLDIFRGSMTFLRNFALSGDVSLVLYLYVSYFLRTMLSLSGNRDRVGKNTYLMESVPNSCAAASVSETGVLSRIFDAHRFIILCGHQ